MAHGRGRHSRAGAGFSLALAGGFAALGATAPGEAQAPAAEQTPQPQAQGSSQTQVYEPSFFSRFAPKNARDMIGNIPGFQVRSNEQERGFGQANQNVLINGRRISGKSNDVFSALERVVADSVLRIEVVDGATLDIPGLSGQVANVIAKLDAFSGSWFIQPEFRENRSPAWWNGSISANGRSGPWSWTAGVRSGFFRNGHDGPTWISNAAGQITDTRFEEGQFDGEEPGLTGTLTYETRTGDVANLNVGLGTFNFKGREESYRNPVGLPPTERFVFISEDGKSAEIGADYDLALGPGRLKLVGLQRLHEEDDGVTATTYVAGAIPSGQRVSSHEESGESIVRGEYGFRGFGGDIQVALEGAFNYLDLVTELASLQATGAYVGIPLPDGTARVEERRAETNLSYSRKLSPRWSLQGSIGGEYSELLQTGPSGQTREFVRPKGYLALAWKQSDTTDYNFKIERRVGQLDFGDFLASVDLQNNNARAGNSDLVPEQSWIATTEINKKLGKFGAVKLALDGRLIEDVVDQIPIGATGSGVGNIDQATAWSAALSGTLNFDPWGLKGVQLTFDTHYARSQVDDPLTGESRRISYSDIAGFNGRLRWDVPETQWAFVAGIEEFRGAPYFRLDEVGLQWQAPSINFFFVENKDVFGLKVRLMAVNLNDTSENFKRTVYLNGRRTNGVDFVEERHRTFGPIFRLNVSGTF